jgi:hypothetical protein
MFSSNVTNKWVNLTIVKYEAFNCLIQAELSSLCYSIFMETVCYLYPRILLRTVFEIIQFLIIFLNVEFRRIEKEDKKVKAKRKQEVEDAKDKDS